MNSVELISSFSDFAREKNIDKPTMIAVLEEVFRTMIRKKFGADENFNVIINAESGDLEMWRSREIVDDNSEDIWEIDVFSGAQEGLIIAEIELGHENQHIELPTWVGEEITGIEKWGNCSLAKNGVPKS